MGKKHQGRVTHGVERSGAGVSYGNSVEAGVKKEHNRLPISWVPKPDIDRFSAPISPQKLQLGAYTISLGGSIRRTEDLPRLEMRVGTYPVNIPGMLADDEDLDAS